MEIDRVILPGEVAIGSPLEDRSSGPVRGRLASLDTICDSPRVDNSENRLPLLNYCKWYDSRVPFKFKCQHSQINSGRALATKGTDLNLSHYAKRPSRVEFAGELNVKTAIAEYIRIQKTTYNYY